MKKLLSACCLLLYVHSFSQGPMDAGMSNSKATGEKVLAKAIAVIMNPEGQKKMPPKTTDLPANTCPLK
jgi:cytochrome bd-type quinol oxidase subunit 1